MAKDVTVKAWVDDDLAEALGRWAWEQELIDRRWVAGTTAAGLCHRF